MNMNPHLRSKIDEIISLESQYQIAQQKKYPDGVSLDLGSKEGLELAEDILSSPKSAVLTALEALSKDELVYVMALTWFGRGDGNAEPGTPFESVLEDATREYDSRTALYLYSKPLSKYLTDGLKRLGIL